MKYAALVAAALAGVSHGALRNKAADGHPIEKVIAMLEDLAAKSEAEGKEEAVAYDKFAHWCATSIKTLNGAITEETSTIATLEDQISGEEKLIASLTKHIAALETEIKDSELAAEEAQKMRDEEAELYTKSTTDQKATIEAMKEAIKGLVESSKGGAAFLETASPKIRYVLGLAAAMLPPDAPKRQALTAFLQRPEQLAEGDKAAHVLDYEFKSGGIIEVLKKLQERFENELLAAEKGETNALNAYNLEKQARDAAIEAAKKSKEEKETTKGDTEEEMSKHKEELSTTQGELAADSTTLGDTEKDCATKKEEWETRSSVREMELEAMAVAQKILAKAAGVRTEAPANPIPPPSPVEGGAASFLQISDPRQKALTLLRSSAKTMHSAALARMVQELSVHAGDPFAEVINMVEKMIFRLQAEQTDEDNHKMWCDQEISKTNTTRTQKEDKIEEVSMKIDEATSDSQQLTMDIEAADKMVGEIVSFMEEAAEIRAIGKSENDKALKDAQDAQTAIADATAVLTDFYKNSGMMTKEPHEALLQQPVELPENPSTWEAGYTGVADPKDQPAGIITVLETVAADFAKMEADTRAQEAADQAAFDEEMSTSTIEKAERAKESEVKNAERGRVVAKLEEMKKKRKHLEGELEAVNQYYKDLGPACYEGDSTYDERKAARTAEIESLGQAQQILQSRNDPKEETEEEPAPAHFLARKAAKKPVQAAKKPDQTAKKPVKRVAAVHTHYHH